jgi:hypothetical protein
LEFPPDTKDKQYHLRSLHHETTGHWLLCKDEFIEWKATPSSLWIKGLCELPGGLGDGQILLFAFEQTPEFADLGIPADVIWNITVNVK